MATATRTKTQAKAAVSTPAKERDEDVSFYNIGAMFQKEGGVDIVLDPSFLEGMGFPVKPNYRYSLFLRDKTSKAGNDFGSLFLCEAPDKKQA